MKFPQILVHIGYPKTASTFLQFKIFNNESLGFKDITKGSMAYFVEWDDFDFSAEKVREYYHNVLSESQSKGLIPVISSEVFSVRFGKPTYQKTLAERLYETFPDAKIFFFIREQMGAIASFYNQVVKGRYTRSIEEFIEDAINKEGNPQLIGDRKRISVNNYKYDLLIDYYQKKFGKEKVLVLPFEMFKQESIKTMNILLDFAEVKIKVDNRDEYLQKLLSSPNTNQALKSGVLNFKRKLNQILFYPNPEVSEAYKQRVQVWLSYKTSKVVELIIPEKKHQQEEQRIKKLIEDNFGNLYQESNRRTSELIGIDLREYGYACD